MVLIAACQSFAGEQAERRLSGRHGRARPGHPRLRFLLAPKTWMPGTSPGMTSECVETLCAPHHNPSTLPVIARQESPHRIRPSLQFSLPRRLAHVGLEPIVQPPLVAEFCGLGIDPGR